MPADHAARTAMWFALASFATLGLSAWLAQWFGAPACNVGTFAWLVL